MSDTCKTCHASIIWAVTASGRPIPIDAESVPNGNLELVTVPGSPTPRAIPAPKAPKGEAAQPDLFAGAEQPKRYTSHFARCPQAAQHRRSR